MCAEQSSAELAGAVVKFQVPSAETMLEMTFAVANLTMPRATKVSKLRGAKEQAVMQNLKWLA